MRHLSTVIAVLAASSSAQQVKGTPKQISWSDKTLGPDGPWNAVTVALGNNQDVTAYPGKMWESFFPGESYCANTATGDQPCYAQQVGAIYNESAGTGSIPKVSADAANGFTPNMLSTGREGTRYSDRISLGDDTGQWTNDEVDNFDMVLLSDTQFQYPNRNKYPIFAGCLSLGASPAVVNQSFPAAAGQTAGAVNMSLLAGTLAEQNAINSQTFGMHIGSTAPERVPGSLWLGGYDRNRAVNDMLAISISEPYDAFSGAPLLDISINVVKGGSLFNWTSKGGLLASGNSSIGHQLNVAVDPCSPYLNLPKSTCDAIAADIPVRYDEGLGLYLWNTDSPDYSRIVRSPSVLSFTFVDPDNNSRQVNISVPFVHLNLTLDQPLVDKPTPYFPCNAASNGNYALGRAFLQDAFLGANLKTAIYFMSQAPGPNMNGESVTLMDDYCRTLETSNNDWVTSWDGYWTPLPGGPEDESPSRTKASTIVGATVGGSAGVMILAYVGFLAWRYHRHGKGVSLCGLSLIKDKPDAWRRAQAGSPKSMIEYWPQQPVPELPTNAGNTWQLPAGHLDQTVEMETPHVIHEMPGHHNGHYQTYEAGT
ncbi:hypothetical protein GGR52DRAFT_253923 [Hypoxylon sp. FL1284]|nr:hypothetical protein GGR52DRAFT_253923 [Hypoxylon sp. FL1284]